MARHQDVERRHGCIDHPLQPIDGRRVGIIAQAQQQDKEIVASWVKTWGTAPRPGHQCQFGFAILIKIAAGQIQVEISQPCPVGFGRPVKDQAARFGDKRVVDEIIDP